MEQEATYVGIDVVKSRVDVATHPGGDVWRVDYDEAGIASLIARLQSLNPAAVLLVSALAAASLPLSWSTPARSGLCQATGRLAKTDALDARVPGPVC